MFPLVDIFQSYPFVFLVFIFIFSLLIGSFLNVVILRLPKMMEKDWRKQCYEFLELKPSEEKKDGTCEFNLIRPRSHCPNCNHTLSAIENIPIISYLFLKGKCRKCGNQISWRYPIIELVTGILSVAVSFSFGVSIHTVFALLLTWSLISLSVIDFEHQLLPEDIVLPLLWLGITINIFDTFTSLESSVLGAIFGYGSLWLICIIFKWVTGKEGMGHGDFKLLAAFGAWFGWQTLPLIIILSSFAGAVIGIFMILFMSHDKSIPIPFGPYLSIAGWITMIWGSNIMALYLHFIS